MTTSPSMMILRVHENGHGRDALHFNFRTDGTLYRVCPSSVAFRQQPKTIYTRLPTEQTLNAPAWSTASLLDGRSSVVGFAFFVENDLCSFEGHRHIHDSSNNTGLVVSYSAPCVIFGASSCHIPGLRHIQDSKNNTGLVVSYLSRRVASRHRLLAFIGE